MLLANNQHSIAIPWPFHMKSMVTIEPENSWDLIQKSFYMESIKWGGWNEGWNLWNPHGLTQGGSIKTSLFVWSISLYDLWCQVIFLPLLCFSFRWLVVFSSGVAILIAHFFLSGSSIKFCRSSVSSLILMSVSKVLLYIGWTIYLFVGSFKSRQWFTCRAEANTN